MARIRSIKPEFWADRKLARLSRDARLLYVALWNVADEHARVQGDVRYVKGHCLPYDDDLDPAAIGLLLDELVTHGRVVRYVVDGDPYLFLPNLDKHQRLEPGKSASRLPSPEQGEVAPVQSAEPICATGADLSESRADFPGEARKIVVQHVAGSMEHVAGSRGSEPDGSEAPPEPDREDVTQVCAAMADAVERLTKRRPRVTETWRTEARRLLDLDKRELPDVLHVIAWVEHDAFWAGNVQSVPKLREKFGNLYVQSRRGRGTAAPRLATAEEHLMSQWPDAS